MGTQTEIPNEAKGGKVTKGESASSALKMLGVKTKTLRSAFLVTDEEYQKLREIHQEAVLRYMRGEITE